MISDFLKKIPFFADLPEADLDRLCQVVEEVSLPAGEVLFNEGSPGDKAYVILEGQLEILKSTGGHNVLLSVRPAGDVIGEMALLESVPRSATVRARTDCKLIAISDEQFNQLLNTSPSAARTMLHTVSARLRSTENAIRQSEKMAQIGTLTAGIAHELNNPAAAANRGASQLRESLTSLQNLHFDLGRYQLSKLQLEALASLQELARKHGEKPIETDSLELSDRQDEIEGWLEDHDVENAWEVAPVLAELNYQIDLLGKLEAEFPGEQFPIILAWLSTNVSIHSLLAEITQGTMRIGEIVKSLKSYVYLDQAPLQWIDLHEGLDNTLVMLRSKLKAGVTVHREYAKNLPRIQAFGSELNQVWTNLIDNATDAMDGHGQIIIRTKLEGDWVVVELEDNGSGIPDEIKSKLFSPFFTTKSVGKGTGLGLNISYNIIEKHGGEITFVSRPGKTTFRVRLPVNFESAKSGTATLKMDYRPDDEGLIALLEQIKTIAVVGISDKEELPAHTVPDYLKKHGYRIIPVNPGLDQVLGEKAYKSLLDIPEPVDTVLIFRRAEAVPAIVDEAIKIGAKIIWMQEGIISTQAAEKAIEAGLRVVMDTCMRATHKRLLGK